MFKRGGADRPPTPHLDKAIANAEAYTGPVELAMSRRAALRLGAGALAAWALAEAGANLWQAEEYGSHGTSLRIDSGRRIKSKFLIVSFGGLGNHDDFYGATTLHKASGNRIPAGDMLYDDINGINTRSMAKVMRQAQKARGFDYLIVNGDSLGALFGLQAACEAEIPVAGLVINCGPANFGDVTTGSAVMADVVRALPSNSTALRDIELAAKDVGSYFRDTPAAQWLTGLPHEVASLPSQMTAGASARLQGDQINKAWGINAATLIPRMYRHGFIHPRMTSAVFLDAPHDLVVNDGKAFRDWGHDLGQVGISMTLLHMGPGAVHADEHAEGPPLAKSGFFDDIMQRLGERAVTL